MAYRHTICGIPVVEDENTTHVNLPSRAIAQLHSRAMLDTCLWDHAGTVMRTTRQSWLDRNYRGLMIGAMVLELLLLGALVVMEAVKR